MRASAARTAAEQPRTANELRGITRKRQRSNAAHVAAVNAGTDAACKALGVPPSDASEIAEDLMPRLQALARRYTVQAFGIVLKRMASEDERVSLDAAQEVLSRGWGKAPMQVNVTRRTEANLDEVRDRLRALAGEIASAALATQRSVVAVQHHAEVVNPSPITQVVDSAKPDHG